MADMNWSQWKSESVLPNGVKVWYRAETSQTAVLYAFVDAGAKHDGRYWGLSHFTEHMLFQGTRNLPGEEVKFMAARNGLSINAATSKDFLAVEVEHVLTGKLDTAARLILEVIANPTFPEENFKREKLVVKNEIGDKEDNNLRKGLEMAARLTCEAPYNVPVLGSPLTLDAISVDVMQKFFASRFRPENVTLCYSGPESEKEVTDLLDKVFGKWTVTNSEAIKDENAEIDQSPVESRLEKPGQKQTAVVLSFSGTTLEDDDSWKLRLLCEVIGGSWMISRMFREIRNSLGLCYYCAASSQAFPGKKGNIVFYGTTPPESAELFLGRVRNILEDVRGKATVTEEELNAAKLKFEANLLASVDDLSSGFDLFATLWVGKRNIGEILKIVRSATVDEMTALANKYLAGGAVTIMVGNLSSGTEKVTMTGEVYHPPVGTHVVDRPTPAGAHPGQPNTTKPPYVARPIKDEDDVEEVEIERGRPEKPNNPGKIIKDGQPPKPPKPVNPVKPPKPPKPRNPPRPKDPMARSLKDNEPMVVPRASKPCSECGKEFDYLDGVNVEKCPTCKLKEIDGRIERVSIYSKKARFVLRQNKRGKLIVYQFLDNKYVPVGRLLKGNSEFIGEAALLKAGAKSPGKAFGPKAGSQLKPASAPPVVQIPKGEKGGLGGGSGSQKAGGKTKVPGAAGGDYTEEEIDRQAEHDLAGAEAAGGQGSTWNPDDHPRSGESGRFIDN